MRSAAINILCRQKKPPLKEVPQRLSGKNCRYVIPNDSSVG
jgi:hypothetical protein